MARFEKSIIEADKDIFEISDFTVVTQLEALIASLESLLHDSKNWITPREDDINEKESFFLMRRKEWKNFYYKGNELKLSYFYDSRLLTFPNIDETESKFEKTNKDELNYLCPAIKEITSYKYDFCESSSISRQFGVFSYVLIRPVRFVIDESLLNTILSAIEIAVLNVECELPVFVQFGESSCNLYFGVCKNRNVITRFESARIRMPLSTHKCFNGIYDLFEKKVNADFTENSRAGASVELDFIYRCASPSPSVLAARDNREEIANANENNHDETSDGVEESFRSAKDKFDHEQDKEIDINYPFGADFNPFSQLNLSVSWLNVNAGLLNESITYTEFDPFSAPKWFVSASFHGDSKYMLSSLLTNLLDCRLGQCSMCSVSSFAEKWMYELTAKPSSALNSIMNNYSANQFRFTSQDKSRASNKNIEHLNFSNRCFAECLRLSKEFDAKTATLTENSETDHNFILFKQEALDILRNVKSAPTGSLTASLTKCLVAAFSRDSDYKFHSLGCLWNTFVKYLRNSWENRTPLPGLFEKNEKILDLSKCLLHQKLQMIDLCIAIKDDRFKLSSKQTLDEDVNDEEENFFDVNETFESTTSEIKAVGGLQPMEPREYLLNYPDRLIYVPETQNFGPMTEDMVERHTSYLSSLDAASGERTRAQIEILLSDMQAFKAANPGCVLEDFVRWHSPRDFVPEENEGKGGLSDRMRQSNSVWMDTWKNANPVPVAQQRRLFNETKEVEKILQHFENIAMQELIDLLLPVIVVDSINTLVEKSAPCYLLVMDRILFLCRRICSCSMMWNLDDFYEIRTEIEAIEVLVSRYTSLHSLLWNQRASYSKESLNEGQLKSFIEELISTEKSGADVLRQSTTNRIKVVDAPRGLLARTIHNCFKDANDLTITKRFTMPLPVRKKYIIRRVVARPGMNSRATPQRIYVSVTDSGWNGEPPEYIIAGSFSNDVTFK